MKLAAIVYGRGEADLADRLMCDVAASLRCEGLRLAGMIQWNAPLDGAPVCSMDFEDLASRRRMSGSFGPGTHMNGCRLDASALEDAAGLAAAAIGPGVDLVIVNRYGKEEMSGRGFVSVIAAAVAENLAVLTSVNAANKAQFLAFAGDAAVFLPQDAAAVAAWCRGAAPVSEESFRTPAAPRQS